MKQKTSLSLVLIGILLISGCISSNNMDDVKPSRINPIIIISDNSHFRLNEPINAKIAFLEYKGEDFNAIPNFKINGVVINLKGIEHPLSIKKLKDDDIIKYGDKFSGIFKYSANFSSTDIEGTYTIKVTTSAGKDSSSTRTRNFVIGTPSKLSLHLSCQKTKKYSASEKEQMIKMSKMGKELIKQTANAMGKNASGVDTIPELNPEGIVYIIAEIETDTGEAPIIERPAFVGEITLSNKSIINIPHKESEKWNHVETKGNKAYYRYDYLLPSTGEYKATLFVVDDSWPETYEKSENATIEFVLE